MRFWFQRPKTVITPMGRLQAAVDELNEALAGLSCDERHIRPYVQSGDRIKRTRPKVLLGYWDNEGRCFVPTYGDD